ncbi:MAG: PEP/pyruvate-binding domain-containing protein [Thermoanaerobaculia bacterium]
MRANRVHDFQDLMRWRIEEILLVASPYDAFILEEDGRLHERMLLDSLDHAPGLTAVASGAEALVAARDGRFDLIITTVHVGDMDAVELARRISEANLTIPVVLLAYDSRELTRFCEENDVSGLEEMFLWQGDVRLLPAIVRCVEDRRNVEHDARAAGVQVILLIEDSVRYTSSFLPAIYSELASHSQRLVPEGMNLSHKLLRIRARPKILLCRTYEEAWRTFEAYEDEILGVICDVEFSRAGRWSERAGLEFAEAIRERLADVPVVLQSSRAENAPLAHQVGASFLVKGSPVLLHDLRRLMGEYFGFGDFVFRLPDGSEVDRAADLKALERKLQSVPLASIAHHGNRNHFSKWLKARTEFALADKLRPRRVSDFTTHEELRRSLIETIAEYRGAQSRASVTDFDRQAFDATGSFYRIGGGSLGGKARGLAFARTLLRKQGFAERHPEIDVAVPAAVVIGTDVFDQFLDENGLRDFALGEVDDPLLIQRFLLASFPDETVQDLAAFLERVSYPLAVRSSSILEDSQYQPFTGVYETLMLANNEPGLDARLNRLLDAIRLVYASTFSARAKRYLKATPYRLEEERMAVILQRIVGADHGGRFYPDFAGVARSHNFYPVPPQTAADGVAAVALGFGRTVVDGGNCVRFCPRAPLQPSPYSSADDVLDNSQRSFWALRLATAREESFDLSVAERDGTLHALGSSYSTENDAVSDGLSRAGIRLVSFAPVLKHGLFPLGPLLHELLDMGSAGMGAPVEIEFAVNLSARPREFGFLQMRPLALSRERVELEIGEVDPARLVCRSSRVMGNGKIEGIRDLVVVDFHRFERAESPLAALEIARLNGMLAAQQRPYLLIGVGRWGSRDPWLGIPVTWDQISGARAIVEAGLKDFKVSPSQGSHFFQNLTSFNVGYFTVNPDAGASEGFVDWEWLSMLPALSEASHVRHLRLAAPVLIKMNGHRNEGVVYKPEVTPAPG